MTTAIDYRSKVILAPMVRIGTLPIRLLSLQYGADLVYTEEIIDFRMLGTKEVNNAILETVDYVSPDGTIAFRTCEKERGKVVFQMGTSDADRALQVAKMVERHVAAIDINMGCPKEFSIKGGMGAALLEQPAKVDKILRTLVNGLIIPVTCKIRVLPTLEETIELVKLIEATGVSAIGIHGRMREERPRHPNRSSAIKAAAAVLNIPVIANGGSREVKCYEDIAKFRDECGVSSIMLARAAQWNPSIFRAKGILTSPEVIKDYLKYAAEYEVTIHNMKYVIQQLMHTDLESPEGHALMSAGLHTEIFKIWDMTEELEKVRKLHLERRWKNNQHNDSICSRQLSDGTTLTEMEFRYMKREYPENRTPKMILYEYTLKEGIPKPQYIWELDKKEQTFSAKVIVGMHSYASTLREKSKKFCEQSAAVVCLRAIGIDDGNKTSSEKAALFDEQLISAENNKSGNKKLRCKGTAHNERSTDDNPENDVEGKSLLVEDQFRTKDLKEIDHAGNNEVHSHGMSPALTCLISKRFDNVSNDMNQSSTYSTSEISDMNQEISNITVVGVSSGEDDSKHCSDVKNHNCGVKSCQGKDVSQQSLCTCAPSSPQSDKRSHSPPETEDAGKRIKSVTLTNTVPDEHVT